MHINCKNPAYEAIYLGSPMVYSLISTESEGVAGCT